MPILRIHSAGGGEYWQTEFELGQFVGELNHTARSGCATAWSCYWRDSEIATGWRDVVRCADGKISATQDSCPQPAETKEAR